MTKIDVAAVEGIVGTMYPSPYDEPCRARVRKRLGDAAGLSQFGVNMLTLPPGAWSSQPHWHTHEDEFVYVVSGEVVLVEGDYEQTLRAGDAAGFKGGAEQGHCLQNRSDADAVVLEVGSRIDADAAHYPELDLVAAPGGKPAPSTHRDGTPYKNLKRRGP